MTQTFDHKLGRRVGTRWACAWLHNRAREMNDQHARAILNTAAFQMGNEAARLGLLSHIARAELKSLHEEIAAVEQATLSVAHGVVSCVPPLSEPKSSK